MAVVTGINAIETSFVTDYTSNIELLVQQRGSKIRPKVRNEGFFGKDATYMEQIGEVAAVIRTTRHGDTPLVPTPFDRRWVFPSDYEIADLIDTQDRLRQIIDPNDPFARAQAMAIGRSMDDAIIEGYFQNNNTGENGTTVVPFDPTNLIANGGTGFTIDKLRQVVAGMEDRDVDFMNDEICCVYTPAQKQDLLESIEVTSADYNTVRALVNGEINTFLGMYFTVSNRLPGASNYNGTVVITDTHERAMIFSKNGMGFGLWDDISSRMDERPDKSYATQVYTKATFGATRVQEDKCWAVDSVHAA